MRRFKAIGLSHGFMVHVWSATENGDEKDSYYWKLTGAPPLESQSAEVFDTPAEAWRDCCLENNLLAHFETVAANMGFEVTRSVFNAFLWHSQDRKQTSGTFASAAEAWMDCCISNELIADPDRPRESSEETMEVTSPSP